MRINELSLQRHCLFFVDAFGGGVKARRTYCCRAVLQRKKIFLWPLVAMNCFARSHHPGIILERMELYDGRNIPSFVFLCEIASQHEMLMGPFIRGLMQRYVNWSKRECLFCPFLCEDYCCCWLRVHCNGKQHFKQKAKGRK
jgi:hypothetical protein